MIILPNMVNWFCQRKDGRLVTNTYSGSYGTHPTRGFFDRPIFEYKVEVLVVNDSEMDSCFRAECAVKIYRKSGIRIVSPIQERVLIGVSKENLKIIHGWLNGQYEDYLTSV